MKTAISNNTALSSSTPSRASLDDAPPRAFTFLRTAAIAPEIFAALKAAGYTKEAHQEGWTRLHAAAGYRPDDGVPTNSQANEAAVALAAIEEDIGPMFKRMQAALRHMHPEQAAFVFEGLHIGRGSASTLVMATLLDRCDELKDGKDRKATRKEDHAALATLEKRGIGVSERKRMRALITIAETPTDEPAPVAVPDETPSERTANLVALHAWVQDWSETARAVIKNRAWLIRLGVAKRRPSTPPPPVEPHPLAPQPAATPTPQAVKIRLLPPKGSSNDD